MSNQQKQMSDQELQRLVEQISITFFGRKFTHYAVFNQRLRSTGGRYHLRDHHLDFNHRVLETYGKTELIKIIKHELCHYHLHLMGKGYRHQDTDFKNLLKATGGSRFTPSLPRNERYYQYQCKDCRFIFDRKRKINTQKYACGKCVGQLSLISYSM